MQANTFFQATTGANNSFWKLQNLYANLPLSEKDKRKWLEIRKSDKTFALIALHNPGLRDNLPRNSHQLSKEIALPISRETQQFETILGNLETFMSQNPTASFTDFLCLDKKTGAATTLDLFSLAVPTAATNRAAASELDPIKRLESASHKKETLSEKCWHAFLVFKELQKITGYRKQAALYAEYLLEGIEKQLVSFPLVVLNAYSEAKHSKEKTFVGRRMGFAGFEEISKEQFLQTLALHLEKTYTELITFYRTSIRYEQMDVASRIRINYLIDRSFYLPKVKENGFSNQNEALRALCTLGGLRSEDMKKEGALLLSELLETEGLLVRGELSDAMEWVVNVSQSVPKWSQFNRMPFADKPIVSERVVSQQAICEPEILVKPKQTSKNKSQVFQNSLLWV